MDSIYEGNENVQSEDLSHYGTPRHSGRYPWGSGKNPQHNKNFLTRAKELEKQGLTRTEVARAFNMSTTQYRALYSIAKDEEKAALMSQCFKLKETGMSNTAIAKELGQTEGTIRNWLDPERRAKTDATRQLADSLKEAIESKPYLDVGKGVNNQLGVSKTQLDTAVAMLENEGYHLIPFAVEQQTNPGKFTEVKVLTKADKPFKEKYKEVRENQTQISSPDGFYFEDYGETKKNIEPPVSIDSKRVMVRYAEDGGEDRDGVIELRKGAPDLSLGQNHYAQVRIAVDGTHYLKGMAMYADDLPPGIDIRFNTNKSNSVPMISDDPDNSVLKPLKKDKDNPFGATIYRQAKYIGDDGQEHQSPLNIVNEDETWGKWSKNLSTQFLSKQPVPTAKAQLALTYKQKEDEFNEICALTNPTVKRKLLESFADDCDSAAVHLKAAAFPRQGTHVILPINSLKDNEVYAPNYRDGEEVILIRYPHAGQFEIPKLVVNKRNAEGKSLLGDAKHAIGINSKVAQQLSGADFDGDTVVVIPTAGQKFKTRDPLPELKDFNPSHAYPAYEGMTRVGEGDGFHKQKQMGSVSNLITDMTIKGATFPEIARAVKHSMVVIDAQKHNLNWKQSAIDNDIAGLKEKYQGGPKNGASTLISLAKSEVRIPERKLFTNTNQMTPDELARYKNGEKIYRETGRQYSKDKEITNPAKMTPEQLERYNSGKRVYEKTGIYKDHLSTVKNMEYVKDARDLSSGSSIENVYADHANRLKALANKARKEILNTGRMKMSATAKAVYADAIASLKAKLNIATKNAPLERQAQLIAAKVMDAKIKEHKDEWDKADIKKYRAQEVARARDRVGSQSRKTLGIKITDREWEAIQSGAISDSTLREILRYADMSEIQKRATPRSNRGMTAGSRARARTLLNMGLSRSEVADELGVSLSTLDKEIG